MYILRADEDVAYECHIAVSLRLKRNELVLRADANEHYFSGIFVEAILQGKK